jgi:tetratricopeptide (TPR) repeat protein/predicted nucleic acid-binding protein
MDRINLITSSDHFVKLCKALFSAEYEDFQTIDDSGGDAGNDGYSESNEMLFAMYCPEKPMKVNDQTYKAKVEEDLDKAKRLAESGKYKIQKWVFVTPAELREPVQTYIRTEAADRGFKGLAWASPKLTELFSRHKHLRSEFPDLIQSDVEQKIDESTKEITQRLDTVEEVKTKYRTAKENQYQRRIDQSREKIAQHKYETAKREYELIIADLESETDEIDPHIRFRAYNNLGVCEVNLNNHPRAAELFEKAYAAEPDLPLAIAQLGISRLLKGRPEEGLRIIDPALEKQPADENLINTKANILNNLGRYSELIPFLRSKGNSAQAHFYEGLQKTNEGDLDGATGAFERLLKVEPDNIRALLLAAQCIMQSMQDVTKANQFPPDRIPDEINRKFQRAIDYLNKAIDLLGTMEQPSDMHMAHTNLSGCYLALGQYDKAIDSADKAISLNPDDAIPYMNKGVSQLLLAKYTEALQNFQEYDDRGGRQHDLRRHVAYCSLKTGEIARAEQIVEEYLADESSLDMQVAELAIDLYSRKLDNEKLNAVLARLEREYPNDPAALRIRGRYLHRRGLEGAEPLMLKAVTNSHTQGEKMLSELDLADVYFGEKSYEKATGLYQRYANPHEGTHATYRYSECLYNSGQYGTLLGWIEILDSKVSESSVIKQVEAYANLYLGNLDKASDLFKGLFEGSPKNIQYLVFYGMCRFRLGCEKDAQNAFDAIKAHVQGTHDLSILVGGYEIIGDWDTALDLSFRAYEDDPNNSEAHLLFISTFMKREQAVGGEFEDKHIKAYQKSLKEFNARFPEVKAIQGIEVKDGDISPILEAVDQMSAFTDTATSFYRDSKAPMGSIPKWTGKHPFDVWAAFTNMPDVGIKVSFGAPDEAPSELAILDANDTVVVDIYPLFFLGHANQLRLLLRLFKKVYVHQSVIDELTASIEDHKVSARKGLTVLGKVDGEHRLHEISPEQIKKTTDLLVKIKQFLIREDLVEIRGFNKEEPVEEKSVINALHIATRDSVYLAGELGVPLYCDDRILRAFLHANNRLPSFSSQTLFLSAQKRDILNLDDRYKLQKLMIDLHYSYVSIDAMFIYVQLRNADYRVDDITEIASVLVGKETSIHSLALVLANLFSILIADKSIPGDIRTGVFGRFLKEASANHNLEELEEGVFINLQKNVSPEKHGELRTMTKRLFDEVKS